MATRKKMPRLDDTIVTIIMSKLDKIDDKLTVMNGSVSKAHMRIDDVEEEAITKTGVMKIIIGGGFLSGLSGAGILSAIKSYLGIV